MSAVFLKILNLAISASWLIVVVLVLRILMKKAPRWISCLLWGLVAIRLICPFSLESALSLIPSAETVPASIVVDHRPQINSGVRVVDNAINPVIENSFSPAVSDSANPMQVVVFAASIVWMVGVIGMCIYAFVSYLLLLKSVKASVVFSGNVRVCDDVKSPFILGVFRPVIYVPSGMEDGILDLVIAHEKAHLKRRDHWWKPLGFALLSIYWFNPLIWVAYVLLCKDIEAACDEKVIHDKDREYAAAYSQALLECSVHRRVIAACPLAFGETGVKERVKGVLNYKKPAFWVVIAAVIICIVVAVCFMTNPKDESKDLSMLNYRNAIALIEQEGIEDVQFNQSDKTEAVHGTVNNADLINFFKDVEWKEEKSAPEIIEPAESLVFVISNDYRITLYKEAAVACVKNMDQSRYYKTGSGDYNDAFSLTRMFTLSDYQEELDKINKELGTEYIFAPEDGRDLKEAEAFYQQMSLDEFREYIYNASEAAKAFEDKLEIKPTKIDTPVEHEYSTKYSSVAGSLIGLSMSVKNVSSTGCTLVFEQSGGNVTGQLQMGPAYVIQEVNDDNIWTDVTMQYPLAWNDIAFLIESDGKTEEEINWVYGYGELKPGHYRIKKEVMDIRGTADYDTYEICAEFDVLSDIKVTEWIDGLELPEGYGFSGYMENIGWQGGFLILPKAYDCNEEITPLGWQYSGILSRIPAEMTAVIYSDGVPDPDGFPMANHTVSSYMNIYPLLDQMDGWYALLWKEEHDLYTAADIGELENEGIDINTLDLTSVYWTFYYVKEGEQTYYTLSLDTKSFTKEEAIKIAEGFVIKH